MEMTELRTLVPELDQMSGVAAILRFPMPEIEEEDQAEESDEEWGGMRHKEMFFFFPPFTFFLISIR